MANLGATFRGKADLSPPTTPVIYNVITSVVANTEKAQALSTSTKKFTIRVRGSSDLKLAFVATESSTKFITIPKGTTWSEEGISFTGTLYFQTTKASQTVEILEWS